MRTRQELLVPLLMTLTVVTGLVDAVSYLVLGRVFVANMTGNVVFLGFALAGAPGLSVLASLAALAAFLVGAAGGGRLALVRGGHNGRHLTLATALSTLLVVAAVVVSWLAHLSDPGPRYLLIALLGLAMGVQNATSRALAVPDATTTVLTLTLTGLAADSVLGNRTGTRVLRKVSSVLAMLAGALVGALLVLHVNVTSALAVAALVLAGTAIAAWTLTRRTTTEQWA